MVLPGLVAPGDRRIRSYILAFFAAAALAVVIRHILVLETGRYYWTLGDWLINYEGGFVRRGLTGTLTFLIADPTGISIIAVAGTSQIALFLAVGGLALWNFSRIAWTGPVLMLLFSPVFLLMPYYYMHMSMSKELFGYLALGLMAASAPSGKTWPLWLGIAVFAVAGLAHEVNAFLAPAALAFIATLWIAGRLSRRAALLAGSLVVISAVTVLGLAVIFQGHGMTQAICDAIVQRGANPAQCKPGGPIGWLERDTAFGFETMWKVNVAPGIWPWFILAYLAAMVPFLLFKVEGNPRLTRILMIAAFAGIITMAPLFVVATDWGRWIAMYVFGLTLLTVTAVNLGLLKPRVSSVGPLYLLYGITWSMPESGYTMTGWGMLHYFRIVWHKLL